MTDQSARFALPFIAPGQAQKEMFHNEALARIDALLQPSAVAAGLNEPPAAPGAGACWVVGPAPTGDWSGQADALAVWTDGGWRFVAPVPGLSVWLGSDSLPLFYDGTAWRLGEVHASRVLIGGLQVLGARQPAVTPPSGGTTVDNEARAAIAAILAALSGHGLTAV